MNKYAKLVNKTEVKVHDSLPDSDAFVKAEAEMYLGIPDGDMHVKLMLVQASSISDSAYIPAADVVLYSFEDIKKLSIMLNHFVIAVEQKSEFIKENHKKDNGDVIK